MRCKACNSILHDSEIRYSAVTSLLEDLCSACLSVVNVMKYTPPQEGPSDEYVIYPPADNNECKYE